MTDLGRQIGERAQAAAEATPPPLLDLVRQYGDQLYACAVAGECGGPDEAAHHERQAKTLFDRIAAVVPQQPVQAGDAAGAPLWQHDCGQPWPFSDEEAPRNCLSCMTPGPWRPLLVGGDPAPERDEVLKGLYDGMTAALAQRDNAQKLADERWVELERLKFELGVEREAEGRANAELTSIVKRLDEADVDSGGASERVGYAIQSMQRGWATATENLARLDTVKSDRETIRGALNHIKDTVTRPAIKALGVQHNEEIVPAIERLKSDLRAVDDLVQDDLMQQSDPLVLSLPTVPEEAARTAREVLAVEYSYFLMQEGWESRFDDFADWMIGHLHEGGYEIRRQPTALEVPGQPQGWTRVITPDDTGDGTILWLLHSDEWHPSDRPLDEPGASWFELITQFGPVEMAPPREPRTWPKLDGDPDGVTAVRGASGQVYRAGRGGWRPDDDSAWCDSFASLQNYDGPLTEVLDEPDGAR